MRPWLPQLKHRQPQRHPTAATGGAEAAVAVSSAAPETLAAAGAAAPAAIEPAPTTLPVLPEPTSAPSTIRTPADDLPAEPAAVTAQPGEPAADGMFPADWARWLPILQLALAGAAVLFGLLWWRSRRLPG